MDRQAFRNRMQQLKQYREQNPGKTYLDFKKYAEGGEHKTEIDDNTSSLQGYYDLPRNRFIIPVTEDYSNDASAHAYLPEVTITANAPKTDAQKIYGIDQHAGWFGTKGLQYAEGIAEYTDYGDVKKQVEIAKLYQQGKVKEAATREAEYAIYTGIGMAIPFLGAKAIKKVNNFIGPKVKKVIRNIRLNTDKNIKNTINDALTFRDNIDEEITSLINTKQIEDFSNYGKHSNENNSFVHVDRNREGSVFTKNGAYIRDGYLYPGDPLMYDQKPYIWWNKNKRYSDLMQNTDGYTVTVITPQDAPDLMQVRSSKDPIGQWNGKNGFVTVNEYVTNQPVSLQNAKQLRYNSLFGGYENVKHTSSKYAEGGEIPPTNKPIIPEEPQEYKGKLYKDRYGRKYTEDQVNEYYEGSTDEIDRFTGKPLIRGLKQVGDIEDAMNITPVGDAISVYDTYQAVKNKDWSGAGLALLPLLPFVPRTGKKINKQVLREQEAAKRKLEREVLGRNVPTVNRQYVERQLDRIAELKKLPEIDFKIEDLADGYNARNRVIEDIDGDAIKRARSIDKQYGTNYEKTYNDLINTYTNDYYNLPDVEYNAKIQSEVPGAHAKLDLNDDAKLDLMIGDKPSKPNNYSIQLNPHASEITAPVIQHEMSHLSDRMSSNIGGINNPSVFPTNKMLEEISNNKNFLDYDYFAKNNRNMTKQQYDNYLHMGTEIKSFMNATRRALFEGGKIKRLSSPIDMPTLKEYMKTLDSTKSERILFDSFKKPNEYLKWINRIPIVNKKSNKEMV